MDILLNLHGWSKVIKAPYHALDTGYIKVPLRPPISILALDIEHSVKHLMESSAISVTFKYTGEKTKQGLLIYAST